MYYGTSTCCQTQYDTSRHVLSEENMYTQIAYCQRQYITSKHIHVHCVYCLKRTDSADSADETFAKNGMLAFSGFGAQWSNVDGMPWHRAVYFANGATEDNTT